MSQLSIITAVHNGLAMNRLYWKALSTNTVTPFELIIIDNHSTDGSEIFFSELQRGMAGTSQRVIHVRNEFNQPYPTSQLQGMALAQNEILCFLNNDIWMPFGWEKLFVERLSQNPLLILSPSGQEAQPTQRLSTQLKSRWKKMLFLSKLWKTLLGKSEEERLWKSLHWMYGSLDRFVSPTPQGKTLMNGIKGDSVICHRDLPKVLGPLWDHEIEAADWHLYLKAAKRHEEDADFPLPQILLDSYVHHFGRYSAKLKYEPFPRPVTFKSIEKVWGKETLNRLWWGYHLPPS